VRDGDLTLGDTTAGAAGAPPAATPNIIYNLSGGTVQTLGTNREIQVGQWERSNAELNVSATGTMIAGGNLIVANSNPDAAASRTIGTVNQTGGTVQVGSDLIIANNINATGTYNLTGGRLNMTGGTVRFGLGIGAFNMSGGRLEDAGAVQFALNQQGGVLAPGASGAAGSTTISGNYDLAAPGTLEIELPAGGASDAITVNGGVNLLGSLDLVAAGAIPQGSAFTIVNNDGVDPVTGIFAGRPNGVPFLEDGNVYTVFYQGGDGNDVVVIPEPTSLSIFGAAGIALLLRRRRVS
jgi:hypothetical protein